MKKLSIYMMALLSTVLMGCNEDFDSLVGPQANYPESPIPAKAVSVETAGAPLNVNLADYIDEEAETETPLPIGTATILDGVMLPANTILKAAVEISTDENFEENKLSFWANSLAETSEITISPQELQDAYFNDITKNPSTTTLYVRTLMFTETGGDAVAIIGTPGENYFDTHSITFTPLNKLTIAPAYYIVPHLGRAGELISEHSGEDVYVDPVFTVIFDAAASGDTWFAIADDQACDAIVDGDWKQLYGIVGGDNEAKTGKLARRNEMGGADNSFKVAEGAKKIRVTINMMDQTFEVEAVNIADAYYLIGGPISDWAESAVKRLQKFSHSSKDVFDDPVFTYVFEGSGNEMWFAFGDDDSCDGIANGDWSKVFGTTLGDGNSGFSGTYARRSKLTDNGSFKVDGKAKFYRVSINAMEQTYEVTPLNFQEYIYEAGVNNEWGSIMQALYCPDGNGTYTGFFYAQDADWSGGKGAFKFTGAYNNWDNGNYGTGTFDEASLTGTLINDGGSGNIMPEPGFYRADVNLADMTFKLTAIHSVYVVGSAVDNDWNTGVKMTYNLSKRCWECDANFTEAGVIKFKGNGTWDNEDGNWGGTMDNIINGSNDNIPVSLTGPVHIEFYPTCDTKSYCTITAR